MSITVGLSSKTSGEIKRFLERYYEKEVTLDDDVNQWIYVFHKPVHSIDLISALMDNSEQFEISIQIQVEDGMLCRVTNDNHNDIIRTILFLYYRENWEENDI